MLILWYFGPYKFILHHFLSGGNTLFSHQSNTDISFYFLFHIFPSGNGNSTQPPTLLIPVQKRRRLDCVKTILSMEIFRPDVQDKTGWGELFISFLSCPLSFQHEYCILVWIYSYFHARGYPEVMNVYFSFNKFNYFK